MHLLPAWELRPFAHLSPPPDVQAAQLAGLFALLRTPAPLIVTSLEALMMRTIPRRIFEDSVIRIALAEVIDLEALVEALASMGYQRVPQTEEPGDFSVRGGIVDVFSPLHHHPVRLELEEEIVTSIRHFIPSASDRLARSKRRWSFGRATFPRLRCATHGWSRRWPLRCGEIGMVRKEAAELNETIENGLLFPGVELLTPYLYPEGLQSIFDYIPGNAIAWLMEPGRILGEVSRMLERIQAEAAAAHQKPIFYPAPEALSLTADEFERAIGSFTAVEAGSLITAAAPREGWATAIEVKSQASLRLGATELTGAQGAPSFEPLAVELKEVRRSQGHALMVVEGTNQAARLRRHLEAYDLEVNTECKSFAELLECEDYRPAIIEGEIAAGTVLQHDGLYVYSEEELFGEPRARRRIRRSAKGALLNLDELQPR